MTMLVTLLVMVMGASITYTASVPVQLTPAIDYIGASNPPPCCRSMINKFRKDMYISFIADLISLMSLTPAKLMSTVLSPLPPTALPSDTALRLTKDS